MTLQSERTYETIRREAVERLMRSSVRYEGDFRRRRAAYAKAPRSSQYRDLLEQMSVYAKAYATKNQVDLDDFDFNILDRGLSVVDDLHSALNRDNSPPKRVFWQHAQNPLQRIRAKEVPYIDRLGVENTVARYLDLPFRCAAMDRLLVDVVIGMEIYALGDEMLNAPNPSIFLVFSPLRQRHVLLDFFIGQALNAGALSLLAVANFVLAKFVGWPSQEWVNWIMGGLVAIFISFFVLALITLRAWVSQRANSIKITDRLSDMIKVYSTVESQGPVSASHVREEATRVSATGVVWSSSLFALLDNVISRSGRF